DATVTHAVLVLGDGIDDGRATDLLLDGILVVAAEQGVFLEEAVCTGFGIAAVQANWLVGPLALEAELPPGFDVFLGAALAILGENGVYLLERQLLDRTILVDENAERIDGRFESRRL